MKRKEEKRREETRREEKRREEKRKEKKRKKNPPTEPSSTIARTGPFCFSRAWKPLTQTFTAVRWRRQQEPKKPSESQKKANALGP